MAAGRFYVSLNRIRSISRQYLKTGNIIEVTGSTGSEIWTAANGGISVYRSGQWVNYTKADGLPNNSAYKLAVEGTGTLWASTYGGVVKFNGTGFESIDAPFGNTNVRDEMSSTADGSVWISRPILMRHFFKLYQKLLPFGDVYHKRINRTKMFNTITSGLL
jgi:ligand-binding sensor domain-containing protein